jgi:hypothetical protein
MSVRWVRRGAVLLFLLFVVAVTWPGMVPFNRIEPLILGLPFSMAWIAFWVVLSFLTLLLLDHVEAGAREEDGGPQDGRGDTTGEGGA